MAVVVNASGIMLGMENDAHAGDPKPTVPPLQAGSKTSQS